MIKTDFPRICISSTQGGGGKTLLSLGLARAFSQDGLCVKPFKKGPDYIDAAWLSKAANVNASNLDLFFLSPEKLKRHFHKKILPLANEKNISPIAIIEGNRGLYDGLNESGECSTAQVAKAIDCPILLCLDCIKATRTIAAIINGLVSFEPGLKFAGVVLNRVGSLRHEQSLRAVIKANSFLPVLGCIPRLDMNPICERHMGLNAHDLQKDNECETILDNLAGIIRENCDLEAIHQSACSASPIIIKENCASAKIKCDIAAPSIGVVRDKALWFYYDDNIDALRNEGCKIRPLSLFDKSKSNIEAWNCIDGLYLGGGFPEDYGEEISQSVFLPRLVKFIKAGMPVYAECGGMILLGKSLEFTNHHWPMSGILDCDFIWDRKPRGLGYVTGQIIHKNPWYEDNTVMHAHEFHYSWCQWHSEPPVALKLERGAGVWEKHGVNYDGICINNLWASYSHIFAPALPLWAARFAYMARNFKKFR